MKNNNRNKVKIVINRDRFIESIYHVVFYGNTMRHFKSVLHSVGDKINSDEKLIVRYSIQWNTLIIFVSLSDELSKYLFKFRTSNKVIHDKIQSFKFIIEPILAVIAEWTDLRSFRNNVLAHNFRIDSEGFKSVHLSNKLDNYDIPNSTIDLITLFKYIDAITKIAEEIFAEEYREALAIVDSFGEKKKSAQIVEDEIEKTNSILLEVNNRIKKYNSE